MTNDHDVSTDEHEPRAGVLAGRRLLPREAALLLWQHNWKSLDHLVEAVATAQAESQFYTEAVGGPNSDGTYDYGWLQINGGHWRSFGYASEASFQIACFDPDRCAAFARSLYVSGGYDLGAWVAYTSGSYEKFLGNAVVGAANMIAGIFELSPVPYVVKNGG